PDPRGSEAALVSRSPALSNPDGSMRTRLVAVIALAGSVALAPALAGAQTGGGDPRQALQNQIGEASVEETQAMASLQAIRDRQAQLDARVADLNAQLVTAEAKLAPFQADIDRITAVYQAVD